MVLELLKSIFGITSPFIKLPVVRADDDDDEEEELNDPQVGLRVKCNELPEAIAFKQKLEECNKRVRAKKKTRETCEEELHDWIRFVDHCIAKDLFSYLK